MMARALMLKTAHIPKKKALPAVLGEVVCFDRYGVCGLGFAAFSPRAKSN
jgi:hypothetical protein